ncbi:hypothetical protein N7462_001232 [Penicillium macrosclerotiorum]|uniref:uncharacterized protein n=1 Tax=Penicillium macrosclerotiorum TaxID=303699 RepID=UPI002547DF5A|nr:uncharacterized protein N7462_001232 [Penicillium macrosclerotiorum]KAJ5691809.1 hypothetical protein N7462_001232 [Penicillium macrosclerotiorum]
MDTILNNLPPELGDTLMNNFVILEVVSMFAIRAYNALETGIVTFDTFKHYRGLYFYSMQVASWGILLHTIPAMVRFVSQAPNIPMSILFVVGWYAMVTGQAVVLYSRLHLVVSDMVNVRWILWMIIINSLVFHVPMTALFFGLARGNTNLARPAAIFDRIQLTGFCIQETFICGIYIHEAIRALKPVIEIRGLEGRKVIINLIWVNALVVLMNVLLLIVEYKLHFITVSFKIVVYSVKLKLEFAVLNRLRSLTRLNTCVCHQEIPRRRRSSDVNIFEMIWARSREIPGSEFTTSTPELHIGTSCRSSLPSSTHEFHQALRETSSNDNTLAPLDTCVLRPSSITATLH